MSEFIDTVHPKLRSIAKDFLLKCKYPFELAPCGGYLIESNGVDNYRSGVSFVDPNVPSQDISVAGKIKLVEGKAGTNKFRIVTRHVQKERVKDYEAKRSVESVSERNALKAMLTHITPVSVIEVATSKQNAANRAEREWKEEFSDEVYRSFKEIHDTTIIEEVRHLQALGVEFKTSEFRHIATKAAEAFEETRRRRDIFFNKHFVMLKKDGSVSVAADGFKVNIFDRFELLPPFIQEAVGMLKLMDVNTPIPEMGVGVGDNMFWVFQKVER